MPLIVSGHAVSVRLRTCCRPSATGISFGQDGVHSVAHVWTDDLHLCGCGLDRCDRLRPVQAAPGHV